MSTQDQSPRAPVVVPGPAPRLLLIQAPYYADVVGGMRRGAEAAFGAAGATLDVVDVAGAFELPAALAMALTRTPRWDGVLILGCVVRGETDHYDHICRETARGIMDLAVRHAAAVGFGLLTVDTLAQAIARSADDPHNKGAEAAQALLGQVALRRRWEIA